MFFKKKRRNQHVLQLIAAADRERDAGNPSAAASLYAMVIDVLGEDFGILMQMGNNLKDSGQFTEAQNAYETAMRIKPHDPDCLLQLGHLHKLMGQQDIAFDYYQKSVAIQPEGNPALDERDRLYEHFQKIQVEKQRVALREQAPHQKVDIFFATSREAHGWSLNLAAMRVYKKLTIYNGWRR